MGFKHHLMNRAGRLMKRGFALLFGLALAASAAEGQVLDTYLNLGSVLSAPQINATNFVNKGLMDFVTEPLPFQTFYTLNYTNTGEMVGAVGWEFDYGTNNSPNSPRSMSANFYNGNYNPSTLNGWIEASSIALPNPSLSTYSFGSGYLWVSATNIVNRGVLEGNAATEIKLVGSNVDLSRGYVYIDPLPAAGSSNGRTNFTSDNAIYDLYWWQTNIVNGQFNTTTLWNGLSATSPNYDFAAPCQSSGLGFMSFTPTAAAYYSNPYAYGLVTATNIINELPPFTNVQPQDVVITNFLLPSNIVHQAVFVYTGDPYISASIAFSPSTEFRNPYQTVDVGLFDQLTGDTMDLEDTIASSATRGILPNTLIYPEAQCSDQTYRPANYIVSRLAGGGGQQGLPPADFLWSGAWNNPTTNIIYADYSCFVDNQAIESPTQPGDFLTPASSVTNLLGRVRINAGNLNLDQTEIRGEGEVTIHAKNVANTQNTIIDCENLSYNLATTNANGLLNVQNFAPASESVARFNGTNAAWSAVWTNLQRIITPSYVISNILASNTVVTVSNSINITNVTVVTNLAAFYAPETNYILYGISDTMLDAGQMASHVPVSVYDLVLHGTNIVLDDNMSVISTFLLDGSSFTLNGALTFPGTARGDPISGTPFSGNPIQNWDYTMAPTLRYFTNNGSLTVPAAAHFGDDGPTNYLVFVNNGVIVAGYQAINSGDLEINNGVNESLLSDFSATADTAVISNAQVLTEGDIDFAASNLLIDADSTLAANAALNFNVTESLSDGGVGADNQFVCQNGFNLWTKPQTGDLRGTTITTITWVNERVDHVWAGEDRGPNPDGFTNNVALNDLVLSPQDLLTAPYYPKFYFSGTGASNGLYVGTLDLSQLGNLYQITNMIAIDPSLTIYYAHMILGPAPKSGSPEQYMDGRFDGHLRWVKNVDATVAAVSASPKPRLSASFASFKGQISLTAFGTPGHNYVIQASTNLVKWTAIFTNAMPLNGQFQFTDPQSPAYPSRFYRAVPQP
jgi:hypothetical protein